MALMPWGLCLGLGAAAYFAFHALSHAHPVVTRPDQMVGALTTGALSVLQYVAPLFCVAAAAVSYRGKRATTTRRR